MTSKDDRRVERVIMLVQYRHNAFRRHLRYFTSQSVADDGNIYHGDIIYT